MGRDRRRKHTISGAALHRHDARAVRLGEGSGLPEGRSYRELSNIRSSNPARAFPPWRDADDVAKYCDSRWPLGTRQRVWLAVLLYTGVRRGDAVRLGRQHVRNGVARFNWTEEDRHGRCDLRLLSAADLEALDGRTHRRDVAFICGANGKPLTKESFGNDFSEACRVRQGCRSLRTACASLRPRRCAAKNGATVSELNALFGWTGRPHGLVEVHLKPPTAERLALGAAEEKLMVNEHCKQSIPAPKGKVRCVRRRKANQCNHNLKFVGWWAMTNFEPPTSCV